MKYTYSIIIFLILVSELCFGQAGGDSPVDNLVVNGDFEKGTEGWSPLWTREQNVGKVTIETSEKHGGRQSVRIEHDGARDWSFEQSKRLDVKEGEIYELSAWMRVQGNGDAILCVVTRDAGDKVLDWSYGERKLHESKDWRQLRSRFVIPSGVANMQVRVIGYRQSTVFVDDVILKKQEDVDSMRNKNIPAKLSISNNLLEVNFLTAKAEFEIKDKRTGKSWVQNAGGAPVAVLDASVKQNVLEVKFLEPVTKCKINATVLLEDKGAECVLTLKSDDVMYDFILWPSPFVSEKGQFLILPVNEGISYPVEDQTIPGMHYILYGGHGLCMPWYGATDGKSGWMALVETPDDAAVRISRKDGLLGISPEWQPQKGKFGSERVIRYVFFDNGGYVAMAKRYREYSKKVGLFKTLEEKRKAIPATDLLVGAVNVWCWENDAPSMSRELQAAGIDRILWSNGRPPDQLKALNEMKVLTSTYDIYQDAMNPAEFSKLRYKHPGWTSEAWANDDLMIGWNGEWVRGWEIETKDGKEMIPCGTLCDKQAPAYAKKRIPPVLTTSPYKCRFIDTTTASPWRECYNPKHPMTRTESKFYKMELLRYVSEGCGLVCGCETGHDAAVPYVHYFEGMLSLGPYRVPDSGRDMKRIWEEVPENVAKFQTGHMYRLPLWELVYHDCVVAQWYWGDYNNKLPKLWDRRDLWNTLYGTTPMFMFDKKYWEENKDRFVKSYKMIAPVARATGYSEMLSHEWLTPDHSVQRTKFANGVTVTANFGDAPYKMPDGSNLPPLGIATSGLEKNK